MAAFDPAAAHQPISRKSLAVASFSTHRRLVWFTLYLYFATVLWSVAPMTAALLATPLLLTKAEIGVAAGWALFLLR